MINLLEGEVVFKGDRFVVVNPPVGGGVGYKVFLPAATLAGARAGERMKFWTHLHVREDAMELYGFLHYAELEFFELLIGISGIGPRSALGVLVLAPVDTLKRAIASGDTSYLTKVSGIGRKTAEKIVLELKEKLGYGKVPLAGTEDLQHDADVLEALVTLGYTAAQARDALGKLKPATQGREARLKEALKMLGR